MLQKKPWQEMIKITSHIQLSESIPESSTFCHTETQTNAERYSFKAFIVRQSVLPIIWLKFLCQFTSISSVCALQTTGRTH